MRIVSLLPSATEILFALGLDEEIAGVSHECNYPPAARTKRVVIHSRIPPDLPPGEIDRRVREYVSRGESIYGVDVEALEALAPDVIVTQDLCHVCAASPEDLAAALTRFAALPKVVCLNPQDIGDVWRDILHVGEETNRKERAKALVEELELRINAIESKVRDRFPRPRVVFLEWMDPLYIGGHWVPEMIERAGGEDLLGKPRTPSRRVTHEEVISAAPEILLIAPCGYSAQQAADEYRGMVLPPGWESIPAVRDGRVFALEANGYFSRPGPRLAAGLEMLAHLFHPAAVSAGTFSELVLPLNTKAHSAISAD